MRRRIIIVLVVAASAGHTTGKAKTHSNENT
jgi:hypothetical protein